MCVPCVKRSCFLFTSAMSTPSAATNASFSPAQPYVETQAIWTRLAKEALIVHILYVWPFNLFLALVQMYILLLSLLASSCHCHYLLRCRRLCHRIRRRHRNRPHRRYIRHRYNYYHSNYYRVFVSGHFNYYSYNSANKCIKTCVQILFNSIISIFVNQSIAIVLSPSRIMSTCSQTTFINQSHLFDLVCSLTIQTGQGPDCPTSPSNKPDGTGCIERWLQLVYICIQVTKKTWRRIWKAGATWTWNIWIVTQIMYGDVIRCQMIFCVLILNPIIWLMSLRYLPSRHYANIYWKIKTNIV